MIACLSLCAVLFAGDTDTAASELRQVSEAVVVNALTQEPVPYANILNVGDEKAGATTDTNGRFYWDYRSSSSQQRLYFSATGYRDTVLTLSVPFSDTLRIALMPYVYELEEVVVVAENPEKVRIGSFDYPLVVDKTKKTKGLCFNTAGLSYGVLIHPRTANTKGKITTIHYFIADRCPWAGVFSLRILKAGKTIKTIKNNKMYRMTDFIDLHKEPIIVRPEKRGWNKVMLSHLNIPISQEAFVILFSALYQGAHIKMGVSGEGYDLSLLWSLLGLL